MIGENPLTVLDVQKEVEAKMEVMISVASPDMIEPLWPSVYAHLEAAIDEDFFTDEATLKGLLLEDRALLFVATVDGSIKGAAVTQIEEARTNVVNILSLGGDDFASWRNEMNDALTLYAEKMFCTKIVALGRKGWERLWPDFKPGKILFCKEIAA